MKITNTRGLGRTHTRHAAIAAIAVASLTLAACGGGGNGGEKKKGEGSTNESVAASDYNPKGRDELKDGGELVLPADEISDQQNPFHGDGTLYTKNVWDMYNPQVVLFDDKGNLKPNKDYVTDIKDEEKDGKTVVTYTINDAAKYNDGTPIDWKTFENTWKANNGENKEYSPSSTDGYELIESVKKGDSDRQAVVTFKQKYPWWGGLFNQLLPIQVKDATQFNNDYIKKLHPEWGAGPFKVEKVDFNRGEISFVRNDKWWGEPAKLERIVMRQMEDTASLNALKAGEIDAAGVRTRERYAVAKQMGDKVKIRTAMRPSNYLQMLNAKAPNLGDIKVREAIMTGIDRAQLAEIRFNGLDYSEPLPGSFALFGTQEGYKDNFGEVVKFDPEKAKKLLEEAGWKEGSNGIREKGGKPLSLRYTLTGDNQTMKASASALQKMMKDIGVDLKIEERPSADFSKIVTNRDFDIFGMGFNSSDPFGVAYFGQTYMSNSELNRSGTGTKEFDKKIRELQKIGDEKKQIERANELEKEAFKQYGIMPYANGPDIIAVKPGLANYGPKGFATIPVQDIGWEK
ncbi:ABC transporter family substrate-binding protein [Corynebacterium resistens]|uniref:ABC transporter family substrate-binding protein n=1 Tax=Corynebacterium resistens TaxID=258224 RepID=UPI0023545F9F|nr:ABC transporter family substrate-binding protein [Corynebacterium resistens]